jgi:diacylglycerol kinase
MDAEDEASMDKVGEAITKLQENAKDLASAATNIGTYAADNC